MQVKIKPIFILNKGENAFRHLDGTREIISDEAAVNLRAAQLSKELRDGLQYRDALLDEAIVRDEQDLAKLKMEALRADGLLLYLIGYMPLQTIFNWGVPVIAFSGQYTPIHELLVAIALRSPSVYSVEQFVNLGITEDRNNLSRWLRNLYLVKGVLLDYILGDQPGEKDSQAAQVAVDGMSRESSVLDMVEAVIGEAPHLLGLLPPGHLHKIPHQK